MGFLSVFVVFRGKNLVLLHLMNIDTTSASEYFFFKKKDIVESKFLISVNYLVQ